MSDEFDANEFLSDLPADDGSSTGGALRKKLEALIQTVKDKDKVIASFQNEKIQGEVAKAWGKVPEKFRGLYAGDKNDPKAIAAWVEAAGALGVIQEEKPAGDNAGAGAPAGESNDDLEQLREFNKGSSLGADGDTDGSHAFQAIAQESRGKSASKNPDVLAKLWAARP